MADIQVKPPHELSPYPFGLLSVAQVTEHPESEDHWARWTAHQFDSDAFSLRLLTVLDQDVTDGELYNGRGMSRFLEYYPFGIEVEDWASTFSLPAQDRFARVKRILECTTGKAIERELWGGYAAQESGNGNSYFTQGGSSPATDVTVTAGGDVPKVALARLEGALAQCPSGQHGTIHMTRRMGSLLADEIDRLDYQGKLDASTAGKGRQSLITHIGTPVVVGTGYTGEGPAGAGSNAAVTNTTEWMFATGYVDVELGAIKVVNEDLSRAITVSSNTNDVRIKAVRTAAVHFEPCCHYAVRVNYSATV